RRCGVLLLAIGKLRCRFLPLWKVNPLGPEVSVTSGSFVGKSIMSESLDSSGTNMARMITFLRAHKRLITVSLVAFCALWLTPSWSEVGPFGFLFFFGLFVMLIVSQIFWVGSVVDLGVRFIP